MVLTRAADKHGTAASDRALDTIDKKTSAQIARRPKMLSALD